MTQPALTDVTWVDLLGRPRAVRVPTGRIEDPIGVPRAAVLAGYGGRTDISGHLIAVADLDSMRVPPWPDAPGIVMADLREPDGADSPLCSRTALRRVLAEAASDGYTIAAASELEFFLLDPATGGPIYAEIENYSITKGSEAEPVMRRVRNELRSMDIPVEASNPEYSGGQMEVNLTYGPALGAADAATLMRSLVRTIARQEGFDATFMAKPWTDQAGNGMHVHQSLWRDGRSAFSDAGRLSGLGRSYLAGCSPTSPSWHSLGARSQRRSPPYRSQFCADADLLGRRQPHGRGAGNRGNGGEHAGRTTRRLGGLQHLSHVRRSVRGRSAGLA